MNMARISSGIALGLALLAWAPPVAADSMPPDKGIIDKRIIEKGAASIDSQATDLELRVEEAKIDVRLAGKKTYLQVEEPSANIVLSAPVKEEQQQEDEPLAGVPRIPVEQIQQEIQQQREQRDRDLQQQGQQTQWEQEEEQGTPVQILPTEGTYAQVITVGTGRAESLNSALDATKSFSVDQVETLAGIAEKLLDTAKGSGMSAETLRQLLTDLQTTPRNQWLGLLPKYKPSPALTAAVLEAVGQIESLNLGVTLSTEEALALADALLKALEEGWTPQWIATIKTMRESFGYTQGGDVIQVAVKLKATEAFLASLAVKVGTDGAAARLPANLNIQKKGDALRPVFTPGGSQPGQTPGGLQPGQTPGGLQPGPNPGGPVLATIRGGLENYFSRTGNYGFVVNLSSGVVSNGFMNGAFQSSSSFDVSGGGGTVSGNNFSLNGFTGSIDSGAQNVTSATLDGTAAQGFGSVGDIGATGTYSVDANGTSDSGSITNGQRVQ